ncbi:MAG: SDR family oxidoreductase [Xanthobacteraceae bacterium]
MRRRCRASYSHDVCCYRRRAYRRRNGGAIAELAKTTLARDFRRINPAAARILLIVGRKAFARRGGGCQQEGKYVAPGAIRTPINTAAWQTKPAYDRLMTLVPDRRIGELIDIARAAVWLASDDSDYVVGATPFVDGGMSLYPGFATGG